MDSNALLFCLIIMTKRLNIIVRLYSAFHIGGGQLKRRSLLDAVTFAYLLL